ncbi:DJ-1/PfpI family protein [uncultured Flavobacterium sp.]|uniref:DJ-1/PfpI family protein n=1 Tax=uncultured Flavobacterium sp. TaxID=165435 RepID=UPI0025FA2ED1|nr:DJ-1/PfpI family protein [uncultured Flavobacterium sp.]
MNNDKVIRVGIPLYEDCTLMDFAGATQVFSAPFGFEVIWLSNKEKIKTSENVSVVPNYNFENHPPIDILFIPGGGPKGVPETMSDKTYLEFIKKVSETAIWRGSVCTGAFLLAAAGVLKNCDATTYWSQIPTLGLLAEKMNLKIAPGYPRYLIDEDNKIFTGGGISSSLDLALELVLRIKGLEIAQKTQLFIQYEPKPPIDSGDPSVAPTAITQELEAAGAGYTKALTAAVEKLLN